MVQHLVSQIAVVSCRLASLHSLTTLVRRRTVRFPPADHSGRSRLALMPYLIFVCCPGIQQRGGRRRRIGRLFLRVRSSATTVLWFAARSPPVFADEDEAAGSMGSAAVVSRSCVTTIFSAVNDPIRMPIPKQRASALVSCDEPSGSRDRSGCYRSACELQLCPGRNEFSIPSTTGSNTLLAATGYMRAKLLMIRPPQVNITFS